ncbi:MAG: hypothetical protein IJ728_05770 [Selenomonadaceae bacterium]|nr:hypothetical protein [Selenomonadaceae bacterium]
MQQQKLHSDQVSAEKIQRVIDGLSIFGKHCIEQNNFNPIEFINYMEPIFKENGYREQVKRIDGGGHINNSRFGRW